MADETQTPPAADPAADPQALITLRAQLQAADRKITEQAQNLSKYQQLLADKEFGARELAEKHTDASTKLTALEQKLAETTAAQQAEATRAATLAKTVERQKLFMSDYTDLAALEAKGRLRVDLEGQDLTEYLNGFREDLKSLGTQTVQTALQGATPTGAPPAAQAGKPNLEMLHAEFDKIMSLPVLTRDDQRRMAELESEILKASK